MLSAKVGSPICSCHWGKGQLAGQDRGASLIAVLADIQEVPALGDGEGFDAAGWVFEFITRQQFGDGEDLQARIAARKVFCLVKARCGGFLDHGLGGLAQGDERAEGSLLPLDHAFQVAARDSR